MKSAIAILLLSCSVGLSAQYRLIFEGDSISEGTGVPSVTDTFCSLLTNNYWRCSDVVSGLNKAISSSKVVDCDNRYTNNIYPHRTAGGTNALLFLEVGVNNIAFQSPATAALLLAEYSNYCFRARSDGFLIAAFTTTSNTAHGASSKAIQLEYLGLMRSNYWRFADYLIDAERVLPDVSSALYLDGLHWTNAGHILIASNIDFTIGLCGTRRTAAIGNGRASKRR